MGKAILLSLIAHLLLSNVAHGNEPQLIVYNKFAEKLVERNEKKDNELSKYSINNEELIELKSFKTSKKIIIKTLANNLKKDGRS